MLSKKNLVLMFLLVFLPLVGCLPSPALPNQAPILTSAPSTTATVGEVYTYNVEATDPDGDTLTYSLEVKPTGMTINSTTGLISWTPVVKGDYGVVVKVSDGALDITQSFTITVTKPWTPPAPPVNHAPIITSIPNLTTIVGVLYAYTIEATDPDGDTVIYSLVFGPEGMTFVAPATISWIPDEEQIGPNDVKVKASDGKKATTQSFTIKVKAVELDHIVVLPETMSLFVGQSEVIKSIEAYYDDGNHGEILLGDCTYTSSAIGVATVSDAGLVSAEGKGSATITVSYEEGGVTKTDKIIVTVSAVELDHIVALPETMDLSLPTTLHPVATRTISVTAHYNDESTSSIDFDDYTYTLDNPDIVTVSATGLVEALAEGTVIITVSYTEDSITETDTIEVTVSVGPVHNTTQGIYYHAIQVAIDEADPGDTIEVAAGTYTEALLINKQLTLLGANAGVNPVIGGRGDESIIDPTGLVLIDGEGSGTIFDGFTVEPFYLGCIQAGVSATISNNIIHGNRQKTIIVCAVYPTVGVDNVTIMNNLIPSGGDAGIYLSRASNCLIEGNKITGLSPMNPPEQWGAISFFINCQNNIITHNILADNTGAGVSFLIPAEDCSGNEINYNNIYGNMMGVRNIARDANTHPRDATYNWWGAVSGPYHASTNPFGLGNEVSDYVDYIPWSDSPH